MSRPLCTKCQSKPSAINYYKDDVPFYRKVCDSCARGNTKPKPRWQQAGYKKKLKCDKCGYGNKEASIFAVFHLDGNLNNCRHDNLKTVCANCRQLLAVSNSGWKQGDLTPDF